MCTRAIRGTPGFQSFVGPRPTPAERPSRESVVVRDRVLGLLRPHVVLDGGIIGSGYPGRRARGPEPGHP